MIAFWIPYMAPGFTEGSEIKFHYARIITLADSLKQGIFPAKLRPMHMKLYGYGIGFFYPDLFIYPPALLIALGAPYDAVMKVYYFLFTLITLALSFRCFKKISSSKWVAMAGTILFMMSEINDMNIFDGGGLPHLFCYMFLPLAFCGLLSALRDEKSGYTEFAVGMTMVLLTHNMIFLTFMFACVLIVLIHGAAIAKKPMVAARLLLVSIVAMVVTTAYWLPAMEQIKHVEFRVFYNNAYIVSDHILSLSQLIFVEIGVFYFVLFAAAVALFAVMLVKKRRMPLDIISVLITSIFLIWFMCSRAVWNSPVGEALNFFEYTDRFDFVLTVLMVMFICMTLREALSEFGTLIKKGPEMQPGILFVSCIILMVAARIIARPQIFTTDFSDRFFLYRDMLMEDWQVSGAEWLPKECESSACNAPEYAKADDGSGADGFKHDDAKYFEVWLDLSKEYYDMPYVYYYGYHAYILDENDNPVRELEVGEAFDDNGYVRVFMPSDDDTVGHVMTVYRKTFIQKLSYVISLLSTCALLVYMILCSGCLRRQQK